MVNTGQNTASMAELQIAAISDALSEIGNGIVVALTQRGADIVFYNRAIKPPAAEAFQIPAAPDARLAFVCGDIANLGDHPCLVDTTAGVAIQVDSGTHIYHY